MRRLIAALLVLALPACAPVAAPAGRQPAALADPGLWADPPACLVVLPATLAPDLGLPAAEAEEALSRHLSGRIDRVLGPGRRTALTRRLGLDLGHPGDRQRFADLTGCRHAAAARIWGGRAWAAVWSETQLDLDLAILRLVDGRPLWQGRGTARRGDGGLPLSPLSAVVATGLAARAALDGEIPPSVLDDALRGVLRELPDFRDPQAFASQTFASRNSSVRPLSSRK